MDSAKRLLVGVLVVGFGLAASLPFHQKRSLNNRRESAHAAEQLLWINVPKAQELSIRSSVPLPQESKPAQPPQPVAKRQPFQERQAVALDRISQPPDLADEFEWLSDGIQGGTGPIVPLSAESIQRGPLGATSATAQDGSDSPDLSAATCRIVEHSVADGDSLQTLAQHYLGSATRWNEIYDQNRDQLANPELLPIGAMLRISTLASSGEIPD